MGRLSNFTIEELRLIDKVLCDRIDQQFGILRERGVDGVDDGSLLFFGELLNVRKKVVEEFE